MNVGVGLPEEPYFEHNPSADGIYVAPGALLEGEEYASREESHDLDAMGGIVVNIDRVQEEVTFESALEEDVQNGNPRGVEQWSVLSELTFHSPLSRETKELEEIWSSPAMKPKRVPVMRERFIYD